jgi:MFS transporter, ACS family, hexuronate transporter
MRDALIRVPRRGLLVFLLSLNFGVVFFDRNSLSFLMPFIQPELRLSNTEIGALTSALSFSWALACLLISRVSDALGKRKPILVICTLIFSCMSFISGIAGSFATLLAARLLMGVAEGGVMPISQALIVSVISPGRRGLAMGVMQNFGSNLLGNFLSPLVLVAVATAYGWRSAFYLAGLPGLVMALLLFLCVDEPHIERPAPAQSAKSSALLQMLGRRNIVVCILMSVLLVGFVMVFGTFMPLVLVNQCKLDRQTMSWLMATFGIASVAYSFLVPGASDLIGRRPVIFIVAIVGSLLPFAAWFANGPVWQLFVLFGLGAAITGIFPIVMATIPSESVDPSLIATVLGLAMGVGEILGGVFAPIVAGTAADAFGLSATLWIMVGLLATTALLAFPIEETAPKVLRRRAVRLRPIEAR